MCEVRWTYLALTATEKTSSLSYHSIVALQDQILEIIESRSAVFRVHITYN